MEKHWGRINKQGSIEVKPIYDSVYEPDENGLNKVKLNDKWDLIGSNATEVAPLKYDHIANFSEGLVYVLIGNNYGYIDTKGNEVIPPQFIGAERFSEGLAAVRTHEGGKQGFIDKTGRIVIQYMYDGPQAGVDTLFIDGKAIVRYNAREGMVDKVAKLLVPFKYDKVRRFSNGMAAVREYKGYNWNNEAVNWGFVDEARNEVISPRFTKVIDFKEGLAGYKSLSNKYGFIDKTGDIVIKPIYSEVQSASEGLIGVCKNRRWGIHN